MPEVWFPGSKEPFRPMNPWGREMPKVKRPDRPQLYQLVATRLVKGKWVEQPLFPRGPWNLVEQWLHVVTESIRTGAEKELRNPHMVAVKSEKPGDKRTLRDLLMETGNAA